MSLRPLPADTWPGDHLVLLDLTRWRKHNDDEECHCDNPRIELCLSPLGAPVELNWEAQTTGFPRTTPTATTYFRTPTPASSPRPCGGGSGLQTSLPWCSLAP